jgi:2-polyprenyl-6-methoxyphenol hydroxylase-like FAD-dependent oxidoreductase
MPIVIVGGGMAGCLLALVLGRTGQAIKLIDLKRDPAPAFRNEKLGIDQIERLRRLGVLACFQEACWGETPISGDGPPLGKPPMKDCGARYDRWIERLRAAWPDTVDFIQGKVSALQTSDDVQTAVLATGEKIQGRLVVLATGRGERLRTQLGMTRASISERHSLCIGFSVALPSPSRPTVQAAIHTAKFGTCHAYVTLFPMLEEVRINFFTYRDMSDPWVAEMRADPLKALAADFPDAAATLAGLEIVRDVEIRSTDLYASHGHVQPGVVLLGDAFHAPCPASGTGMTRILNDVERLALTHLPTWLSTPGMGADKIAAFYADPVKRAVDDASLRASLKGRQSAVDTSLKTRLRRNLGRAARGLRDLVIHARLKLQTAALASN